MITPPRPVWPLGFPVKVPPFEMNDLSQRLAALTPEQRRLFELRRSRNDPRPQPGQGFSKRTGAAPVPCSPEQSAFWFFHQLAPNKATYNVCHSHRILGDLDPAMLERGLNALIARHEILRTTFRLVAGRPHQIVAVELRVEVPVVDLSGSPNPDSELETEGSRWIRMPMDMETGPLLRFPLLRLRERDHVLLGICHHAIIDWWSYRLLFHELFTLYRSIQDNTPDCLPESLIQFADYSLAREEWLQSDAYQRQRDYWIHKLKGAPQVLSIPTDFQRPSAQKFDGASETFDVSARLLQGIRVLNRRANASTFMTLLAATFAFLRRYSGQETMLVGSPFSADRQRPETANLIGYLLNTLVLRGDVVGNPTFIELLSQTRATCLEAFANDGLPFPTLVEHLKPERDASRMPLYQVEFLLVNSEGSLFQHQATGEDGTLSIPGLDIRPCNIDRKISPVDLQFAFVESQNGLWLLVEYSRNLFRAETIQHMGNAFLTLLGNLLERPEAGVCSVDWVLPSVRLSELELLSQVDREKLVARGNGAEEVHASGPCIQELFEAQVKRRAEAVAVVFEGREVTYRELNVRANRVAHHLKWLGVGSETLVGLCVERSVEMVVGILGILKAGGVYVPLDPAFPPSRLAYMLKDARVNVVVTEQRLAGFVESLEEPGADAVSSRRLVRMDGDGPALATHSDVNPAITVHPANLAYIIYTSGSTGWPKGVPVSHQAVVNLLQSMQREPGFEVSDVLLAITTLSFDIAALEIFLPLSVGARVVMASRRVVTDGQRLREELKRCGANVLQATPATWRMLIEAGWEGDGRLKMLCGGEVLSRELADQLLKRGSQLWNMYGPTETTVYSCLRRIEPGTERIAIGRPIANTEVRILDDQQRLLPIGVAGELCIGGAGLARGYLNLPDLTAEKFIGNPISRVAGARLYRSGDLGRWLADGNIEYLGRIDEQVKIRGFRIELGEIESVLREQKGVNGCVVVMREETGEKRLVGYVVVGDPAPTVTELRGGLRARLPEYMVPGAFVFLEALPLTANGKVDRRALPAPSGERQAEGEYVMPGSEMEKLIAGIWQEVLQVEKIGVEDKFFDLGGHSLLLVQVHSRLLGKLERKIGLVELFQYPTVKALAEHLSGGTKQAKGKREVRAVTAREEGIAIIGLSGRFPGAKDVEAFWANLRGGVETIRFFTVEELEAEGWSPELLRHPQYVRAKGMLEGVDLFDAGFFGYSPREAEVLDPQQRLFLECAWEALERAGYDAERYEGRIGVYGGVSLNSYWEQLKGNPELVASVGGFQMMLGGDKDFLATRVSYKMNLRGPSVNVQTACSTSLVAVHMACGSLLQGECEMALAGGVSVMVPVKGGYIYQEDGIASPDGHCRAFDALAAGTVLGNGVGIVVLKRLSNAMADGDVIHAVIKGSAINNDGAGKLGYTAPSVTGQSEVILAAQALAGVSPETISYVETHGTATALGDPVEIEALTQAFRVGTPQAGFCAIGSVKSNVGHLDAAAGVAGLIKTVLALKHEEIPASLHFERPNPKIDFTATPFFVNASLRAWPRGAVPRRACVSSFGMGGTNAHVVLEEAPERQFGGPSRSYQMLAISARTPAALERATENLRQHLEEHPEKDLADVAYTLAGGRKSFGYRRALVCRSRDEAIRRLGESAGLLARQAGGDGGTGRLGVVFLFSGQGTQYVGMGHGLYEGELVYREAVDRCAELLRPHLGLDVCELLHGAEASEPAREQLNQTWLAQPALFVVEYALTQLWASWGVKPVAMIGHSIGEYVAACLAGVFSLEDGLRLVAMRARLMQSMAPGSMLAIPLGETEVVAVLEQARWQGHLSLAAVNSPRQCVVSGPAAAMEEIEQLLREQAVECRRLHTSHAFHSAMMAPMRERFEAEVRQVRLARPTIPYLSNVTGGWIQAEEATSPEYWVRQLREPVRFADGVRELLQRTGQVYVEVGPGRVLGQLVLRQAEAGAAPEVVASLPGTLEKAEPQELILQGLGRLWVLGAEVDWKAFSAHERRVRVVLPTYPFERQRFWVEDSRAVQPGGSVRAASKRPDIANWFYARLWKQLPPLPRNEIQFEAAAQWLVFADELGLGRELVMRLRECGQDVVSVTAGEEFRRLGERDYQVSRAEPQDYERVIAELPRNLSDLRVVHTWTLASAGSADEDHAGILDRGYFSLLSLSQALIRRSDLRRVRFDIVSTELHAVAEDDSVDPFKALLLGLCAVIPQECPGFVVRSIDLPLAAGNDPWPGSERLLAEIGSAALDRIVACRGRHRWAPTYEPMPLPPVSNHRSRVRERGVYLVTGGLGRVGMAIAEYLARTFRARLVLTTRTQMPPRETWHEWTETVRDQADVAGKIRKIEALEVLGGEVLVVSADVADLAQVERLMQQAETRFGALNGVIHAAGQVTMMTIPEATRARCQEQFRAKVQGFRVLERALEGKPLDFCVLTSSLAAVLGGLGFAAYASANAFMDAAAQQHNRRSAAPWISVNWDGWQFGAEATGPRLGTATARMAMSPEEGVEAFARILNLEGLPQVIVSTGDLQERMSQWLSPTTELLPRLRLEKNEAPDPDASELPSPLVSFVRQPRPNLQNSYVAPQTETERIVTDVWEELLAFDKIGVNDNFFELGGHSLLAVQLMSRLRVLFQVQMTLHELLEANTPGKLAQLVENMRWAVRGEPIVGHGAENAHEEVEI